MSYSNSIQFQLKPVTETEPVSEPSILKMQWINFGEIRNKDTYLLYDIAV